jgi:hypothetical protein
LSVGIQGRVTPPDGSGRGNRPVRIREEPGTDKAELAQMPVGSTDNPTLFTVLEGPQCGPEGELRWWRIDYNGVQGWAADGIAPDYFIEPAS